jgi:glyoxylase-like metal-dependent hydrolase (beta-lactamase superfamily II)
MLEALEGWGLTPESVDYLIPTHVHLDHAGGTAALLTECTNATVLAHPKCAKHLIAPERIIKGAKMIYGEDLFNHLYGEIAPVPEDRIRVMEDDEVITWGDRALHFFYTYGHASHHFSIHDRKQNVVFTGDSFGIGRTEISRPGPSFLACSCSPPDFDAEEARKSLDRILNTGAAMACVGHYGPFTDLKQGGEQLLRSINAMEAIQQEAYATDLEGGELSGFCHERVRDTTKEHLDWCDVVDPVADLDWMEGDMMLNAQGIAVAVQRQRKKAAAES